LLIDGHPEHSASSAEVTPLLNLENHSKTCVHPIACSPKCIFNISKVSVAFSLSLKENLMHTHCSAIFLVRKNCNWNNMLFYLTRYYSTIARAGTLFQAGNDSAGLLV
jgi:hypothetical protein